MQGYLAHKKRSPFETRSFEEVSFLRCLKIQACIFLVNLRNKECVSNGFLDTFEKQGGRFHTNYETQLTHRSLTPPGEWSRHIFGLQRHNYTCRSPGKHNKISGAVQIRNLHLTPHPTHPVSKYQDRVLKFVCVGGVHVPQLRPGCHVDRFTVGPTESMGSCIREKDTQRT